MGQAFRHDVAYKAPPYCLQLPPGSQYFIMIFPYFQSCHCRSLTNKSRVDHPTSDPAMQKRQQQCFGSAHRSCDTSTEIRVESCESLKRDVEDHEIVNNRNQIYCAACFKNLKEIGFERKTKRCVRFDAPFMKDCEFQLRTFGRSKAASRRCGFRRWPVTARRGETRKALATALVRWLPEPSNDGSCPPDWTSVGLRCLMITVAYNTNFKI